MHAWRKGRAAGRVGSDFLSATAGRVGSGQSFAGSGRVGSKKSDPWTTLKLHQPKSTVVSTRTLCAGFSGARASALTVC